MPLLFGRRARLALSGSGPRPGHTEHVAPLAHRDVEAVVGEAAFHRLDPGFREGPGTEKPGCGEGILRGGAEWLRLHGERWLPFALSPA